MADRLKIGIIGLGKMGQIRAREIARRGDAVVVAGADTDASRFAHFPGVACHTDWRAVIAADVDAVVVCTPNAFTEPAVVAALDAGKHVFSEKPPGRSVADVESMAAAALRNPERKLMFGFNHRWHLGIQEAKRILDSGRLGEILWLRAVYGKSGAEAGFEQSWRSSREICGGGILLDQGIHMLDLLRFFCGDFVEIKSMVSTAHWNVDVEDNAFALLRDRSGRVAMLHSSSTQWKHRFNLEVYTSGGYLSVNGILSSTRSYGEESITVAKRQFDDGFATGKPREEVIYFDTDPSWEREIEEFIACVQEDRPVTNGSWEDALAAMKLVFDIYQADESGFNPYAHAPRGEAPAAQAAGAGRPVVRVPTLFAEQAGRGA
ncbi:MAG TPA: Gfo/Idh/MocA family oxidoreductase [Longimicrobium sp.]|nr:Gfo/Idh/MocA family oxidoreductase [Longimicrobium sp.]